VTQYGAVAALNGPQDATRSMAQEYQLRRDVLFDAPGRIALFEGLQAVRRILPLARILPDWPGYGGMTDDWSMTNYLIDQSAIVPPLGQPSDRPAPGHIRFAFSCSTGQVNQAPGCFPGCYARAKK